MESLVDAIDKLFTEEVYKCVISNPSKKNEKYKKIVMDYLDDQYFIEKYTESQVFHEKMDFLEAKKYVQELLDGSYRNLNSWDSEHEYSLQISKRGKLFLKKKSTTEQNAPKKKRTHNREKNYILEQGRCIEPLIDMGIFTPEGKVINSMYDKYKQINRFIEIVDDEIRKTNKKELKILDFGCGKSYLTFVLYYYFTEIRKLDVEMLGLDLKEEVIEQCKATAKKYGYSKLSFEVGDISHYKQQGNIDIVISLHACDTATDYALYKAISWKADMIFSVPCCQHELNSQMKSDTFSILTRYGIVKERFSSLVTDAIRCNLLESCGYKTQMLEFVAFDHTPKNIMIRAIKTGRTNKEKSLSEVEAIMREFQLKPSLYNLLKESNYI